MSGGLRELQKKKKRFATLNDLALFQLREDVNCTV